jgi:hypothetical protein
VSILDPTIVSSADSKNLHFARYTHHSNRFNNPHTVHIFSSHFLHNSLLSSIANAGTIEIGRGRCKGEEVMIVKAMVRTGVVAHMSTTRSPFLDVNRSEVRGAGEEENDTSQHHEKRVKRIVLGEDFIVFAAVASAYLLAWAASRVF